MHTEEMNQDSFASSEAHEDINSKQDEKSQSSKRIYDHGFIKSNFCPIKFSRNDIKNLSSDFEDQSLGGHRKYREELINGRLAKVYIYEIKILKYENEILEIHRKVADETNPPLIIVENNLIVPFTQDLALSKQMQVINSPIASPFEQMPQGKRGRPRKYPKGEEPYRTKKRMATTCFEGIPETVNDAFMRKSNNGMFSFRSDFDNSNIQNMNNGMFSNRFMTQNGNDDFNLPPNPFRGEDYRGQDKEVNSFNLPPNPFRGEDYRGQDKEVNSFNSPSNPFRTRNIKEKDEKIDDFLSEYLSPGYSGEERKKNMNYKKDVEATEYFR